ncbi:MAG: thioredoxin domain-containing protein [Deltaproteobacteria bacterium]
MSEERRNRLYREASAYLKSAAHQPVDWYPWGEEAFQRASELDRPLLLDVGAAWCHWCHVIDRESYDDPSIAEIINENFIAVKVDRDERPDVDKRYQQAVSAITGQGGWPLTAFLTPEGRVFFGGTYFPPQDTKQIPSFRSVLQRVVEYYATKKQTALSESKRIDDALSKMNAVAPSRDEPAMFMVDEAIESIMSLYDTVNGGFALAPKFPHFGAVELILARAYDTADAEHLAAALRTLDKMAKGGICDHIGGGFHRYATDAQWIVPHFEKMSYDNAEHLKNYLSAYQATGDAFYADVAGEIIRFIFDDLSDAERGGFYASQDADVNLDDDGDYFTWTKEEVMRILSPDEARAISLRYNVHARGEMKHDPARNVLFADEPVSQVARRLNLPEDRAGELLASGRRRLIQARRKRQSPFVDKTIYTSWNASLISSFLLAYKIRGRRDCRDFALKTLDFLIANSFRDGAGFYRHYSDGGGAGVAGFLDDQAKMGIACLDAFEASARGEYLLRAMTLSCIIAGKFYDNDSGGFFDIEEAPNLAAPLRCRIKPIQDDPTPSANASAVIFYDRLYYLTGSENYREYAYRTLKCFTDVAPKYGLYAAGFFTALCHHVSRPVGVVVVGDAGDGRAQGLAEAAWSVYRPNKFVVRIDPADAITLSCLSPAIREIAKLDAPVAVVCAASACAEPVTDARALKETIKTFGRR